MSVTPPSTARNLASAHELLQQLECRSALAWAVGVRPPHRPRVVEMQRTPTLHPGSPSNAPPMHHHEAPHDVARPRSCLGSPRECMIFSKWHRTSDGVPLRDSRHVRPEPLLRSQPERYGKSASKTNRESSCHVPLNGDISNATHTDRPTSASN
jgi:hypothetical protein